SDAMRIIVHDAEAEGGSAWSKLGPRARGRTIVEMARAVLTMRVGNRPTLLLIEDVQWADEASAPALEAIANLSKHLPLLVFATARTGDMPEWIKKTFDRHFVLEPLARVSGLAMLDELLGASPGLGPLKARILEHTGAMPLFIEEVCRGLF